MPSAAKACTKPSDRAPSTSGRDPAALALVIWDWSWSSPIATSLTLMLVCCWKRSTMAWVAFTRSGLSSALQNVRVVPMARVPASATADGGRQEITPSRATTKLRARIATPPWLAPLGAAPAPGKEAHRSLNVPAQRPWRGINPGQPRSTWYPDCTAKWDRKRRSNGWLGHGRCDSYGSRGPRWRAWPGWMTRRTQRACRGHEPPSRSAGWCDDRAA